MHKKESRHSRPKYLRKLLLTFFRECTTDDFVRSLQWFFFCKSSTGITSNRRNLWVLKGIAQNWRRSTHSCLTTRAENTNGRVRIIHNQNVAVAKADGSASGGDSQEGGREGRGVMFKFLKEVEKNPLALQLVLSCQGSRKKVESKPERRNILSASEQPQSYSIPSIEHLEIALSMEVQDQKAAEVSQVRVGLQVRRPTRPSDRTRSSGGEVRSVLCLRGMAPCKQEKGFILPRFLSFRCSSPCPLSTVFLPLNSCVILFYFISFLVWHMPLIKVFNRTLNILNRNEYID